MNPSSTSLLEPKPHSKPRSRGPFLAADHSGTPSTPEPKQSKAHRINASNMSPKTEDNKSNSAAAPVLTTASSLSALSPFASAVAQSPVSSHSSDQLGSSVSDYNRSNEVVEQTMDSSMASKNSKTSLGRHSRRSSTPPSPFANSEIYYGPAALASSDRDSVSRILPIHTTSNDQQRWTAENSGSSYSYGKCVAGSSSQASNSESYATIKLQQAVLQAMIMQSMHPSRTTVDANNNQYWAERNPHSLQQQLDPRHKHQLDECTQITVESTNNNQDNVQIHLTKTQSLPAPCRLSLPQRLDAVKPKLYASVVDSPDRLDHPYHHYRPKDDDTNDQSSKLPRGEVTRAPFTVDSPCDMPFFTFPTARYSTSLDSGRSRVSSPGEDVRSAIPVRYSASAVSDLAASMIQHLQLSNQSMPRMRAVINTGGKFVVSSSSDDDKNKTGNFSAITYEGGEVRLLSLPQGGCSFLQLITLLAKQSQRQRRSGFGGDNNGLADKYSSVCESSVYPSTNDLNVTGTADISIDAAVAAATIHHGGVAMHDCMVTSLSRSFCIIRYSLPSDPSVFVDVVDDEDVRLMFEEISELSSTSNSGLPNDHTQHAQHRRDQQQYRRPTKLRLYVEWLKSGHDVSSFISASVQQQSTHQNYCSSTNWFATPSYSGCIIGPELSSSLEGSIEYLQQSLIDQKQEDENVVCGSTLTTMHSHNHMVTPATHAAHQSASDLKLAAVRSDQLECIRANEVILLELLGTGTFGDMYRGVWRDCTVGVKCLNPASVGLHQYSSHEAWATFLRDANQTAALRHPNLVEVYGIVLPGNEKELLHAGSNAHEDLGATTGVQQNVKMGGRRKSWDFGGGGGSLPKHHHYRHNEQYSGQRLPGPITSTPALVMEYVSGRSLRGAIERKEDAVQGTLARVIYALDVSRAMQYLHGRKMPHFDLKSSNILIGSRNNRPSAKVVGYGLSHRHPALRTYTPGVTMSPGIFPWCAPEILRHPDRVSNKADVYSFAIVMWELWALKLPYADASLRDLILVRVNTDQEVRPELPPPGNPPDLAPGWSELMQRCWREDPEERPDFDEIGRELMVMVQAVKESQKGRNDGGTAKAVSKS